MLFDEADGRIVVREFAGAEPEVIRLKQTAEYHPEDREIVEEWLSTVQDSTRKGSMVDAQEALRTHALVFAAEQSRKEKRIVELAEYYRQCSW
jgi:predicted dehydrogenase